MHAEEARAEAETKEKLRLLEEAAKANSGNEDELKRLRAEQKRLSENAKARQDELEKKLQEQIAETENMRRKKGMHNVFIL